MARLLHERGYKEVWPLLGGFDAWLALGYPVERHTAGLVMPTQVAGTHPQGAIAKETTPAGDLDSR